MKTKLNKIEFSVSIEIDDYAVVINYAHLLKRLLLEPIMQKFTELGLTLNVNFREIELDINNHDCPFTYSSDGIEIRSHFDRENERTLVFDVVVFQLSYDLEPAVSSDDDIIHFQ